MSIIERLRLMWVAGCHPMEAVYEVIECPGREDLRMVGSLFEGWSQMAYTTTVPDITYL